MYYSSIDLLARGGKQGRWEVLTSHDDGQNWVTFTPTCNGAAVQNALNLEAITPTTLLGVCNAPHTSNGPALVVQSTDGQTWTALPAQPPGEVSIETPLFVAPDGTQYIATTGAQGGILRLPVGAATWQMVDPYTTQSSIHALAAVSWDVTGHTVALWGILVTLEKDSRDPSGKSEIPTGFSLAYHAAASGQ